LFFNARYSCKPEDDKKSSPPLALSNSGGNLVSLSSWKFAAVGYAEQ